VLKTYVVVRADLTKSQRGVQAGHALAELCFQAGSRKDKTFQHWVQEDRTLVILQVPNEEELEKVHSWFEDRKIPHSLFKEPDLGDSATALAVYPSEQTYQILADLPLA
jgi:peptidyl-tRNA hydrolase